MPLWQRDLGSRVKDLVKKGKWEEIASLARENKKVINELIPLLEDADRVVRGNAAGALGRIAEKDAAVVQPAVHQLIRLLEDAEGEVRGSAALALGVIAQTDAAVVQPAAPRLIQLLEDPDAEVRGSAAEALGEIAQTDAAVVQPAAPRLIKLLDDDNGEVRGNAAWALANIAEKDAAVVQPAAPRLIKLLDDAAVVVRGSAALALVKIAVKDAAVVRPAAPRLIQLLDDADGGVRGGAALALAMIAVKDAAVVRPAAPRLIQLLDDADGGVRGYAALALAMIARTDAAVVKPAVPRLIHLLEDPEEVVRGNAALALGEIAGEDAEVVKPAVSRLEELQKDSGVVVRKNAEFALRRIYGKPPGELPAGLDQGTTEGGVPTGDDLAERAKQFETNQEKRVFLVQSSGRTAEHIAVRFQDRTYADEVSKYHYYRHENWEQKKRDLAFGNAKPGDYVLQYCTGNVQYSPNQIRNIYEVVGLEKIGGDIDSGLRAGNISKQEADRLRQHPHLMRLKPHISLEKGLELSRIREWVEEGKLSRKMGNCGRQGFNICQVEMRDYETVINWVKVSPEGAQIETKQGEIRLAVPSHLRYGEGDTVSIVVTNPLKESVPELVLDFSAAASYFELAEKIIKFPSLPAGAKLTRSLALKPLFAGEFEFAVRLSSPWGEETRSFQVTVTQERGAVSPPRRLEEYCHLVDASPYACGGFADIFRATEKSSGEMVAVKLPRVPRRGGVFLTLELKTINEFLGEADRWSRLKHPHIVAVKAWGDKPLPWIAMEFAPEGSLRERLSAGKLSLREARDIAVKLCSALDYAHHRGVAHLDIKPENVLLVRGEPRLSDWGTAKTLLYESVTRSKFTPEYAAPEQLDSRFGEPDWRTDIYQLGVMLYEMVSGKLPFRSQIPALLLQEILEKTPEKVSQENPEVPAALDEILRRALAKRKEERYEGIVLLRKELEAIPRV